MNFEDLLEWYKCNRSIFYKENLYCEAFYSIDCHISNPTKEIYRVIAEVSVYLYMKDEYGIGISKIAYFLSMEFEKNNITLEEIQKANKWDLLDAVYENDIKYLKKHN